MRSCSIKKRIGMSLVSMVLATVVWGASIHFLFQPKASTFKARTGISVTAAQLAARFRHEWSDKTDVPIVRSAVNSEWDLMHRMFLVLALGNMSLRDPLQMDENLVLMDKIIDRTLAEEQVFGQEVFLLPYVHRKPFVVQPASSHFVDGEVAMMIAVRQFLQEKDAYREPLSRRIDLLVSRMEMGPMMLAESYPDECWLFCNSVALAAIRVADGAGGTDHQVMFDCWLESAQHHLVDPTTGLLISSTTYNGTVLDGPEGSSIWMTLHCLQLIYPEFAESQYVHAKELLHGEFLGFGYAKEWPSGDDTRMDVDSGPVVPIFGASASSSGLALVADSTFDNNEYLDSIVTTLNFAAFPVENEGTLKYAASNEVGDAVLLYAAVLGPLWEKVSEARNK